MTIEEKKLIEAAKLIKEYCSEKAKENRYCNKNGCIFYNPMVGICKVKEYPVDWDELPSFWEKVRGGLTPGGDPCYICPKCHSEESRHINGIECHTHYNFCPNCGAKLEY